MSAKDITPRPRFQSAMQRQRPSIWHEEAHPGLTHSLVAIGAFFAGVIILGALAVHAETNSSPTVISQLNEITVEINLLKQRIERIESSLGSESSSVPATLVSDCETLMQALPIMSDIRRVPSSVACYQAPGINHPDRKYLSATALYQYIDRQDEPKEITVQIYDLADDEEAVADFLTKGAYLPIDYNRVKRQDTSIGDLIGVFTYDGVPVPDYGYERGANWLVVNGRFGIVVHGEPVGFTDRNILDKITEAVDTDLLMNIR